MFFVLSKTLQYLVMPLLWIVALLGFGLISKKQARNRKALWLAVAALLFFTNPFLINEVWLAWEPEPVLMQEVPHYDAAVVLTGVTRGDKSPHDRTHYGEGSERILDAIQLYKMGKVRKIIISGGSGSLQEVVNTEAHDLQQTALYAGVPAQDILLEEQSRNTRENARFTKELVQQQPRLQRLLLLTSAFHMRRAAGCFAKAGLAVATFPVDFQTHDRSFTPDDLLVPSAEALYKWEKIIHEWVGVITYKLLGYA
ncbi:YdcF family protein [Rufibacter ruber]|uniref:YdcF family protein n=1 Tax=Rufibacter ruber TaxID=1783499 RepID=UPI00082B8A01|nr:YdcF family protein [Rufibacter ruber]